MSAQQWIRLVRITKAVALVIAVAAAASAQGATFVVTNTADTGPGSLRQAIMSANATPGVAGVINFNIPGTGPFTNIPVTPLPTLTSPVVINGYSQPGSSVNTLANGDDAVLKIFVKDILVIDTTNSTISGLVIQQIKIGAAPGPKGSNVVEGCFVGVDVTGTNSLGSMGSGVFVQTPTNRIGGTNVASRNIISGKETTGIEVFESFALGNVIQGNYLGTDRTGTRAIGNGDRCIVVNMAASTTTIGGTVPGAGNLISGNLNRGITLDGANNTVRGNFIGTDVTGTQPLGNARTGVEIGGPGNVVGGTNAGAGNIIAFNGVNGQGATTNGVDVKNGATGYSILGNSIFDNTGLGIDVNADMLVTAGYPVLTLVSNTGTTTLIRGSNAPSTTFRIELFTNPTADPSGFGEGKTLFSSTNVTTDAMGNFTISWPTPIAPGLFVTATANGTSEFSQARAVALPTGPNSWTSTSSGKWETGPNWSLNLAPYGGNSLILITNTTTKTVNNDLTTANGFPGTLTISNLTISAPGTATNTLLVAHGGTFTPLRILQNLTINRGGNLVISNAALNLEKASGTALSLDGTAELIGGRIQSFGFDDQVIVGNNGTGALTVSNGDFVTFGMLVGANGGTDGSWRIAGGAGFIDSTLTIANSLTATGTVTMSGGQLQAPTVLIGNLGKGRLAVTNGMLQCSSLVTVASQNGSEGTFIAMGSTNLFGDMIIGENPQATGAVLVAGSALVQINGSLENSGTITVAGGRFDVLGQLNSVATNNAILVTGGQFSATNDNSFLTRVTVSNGTFFARDPFLGNGRVGTCTVAGGLVGSPGSFNGFNVGVNGGTGTVFQVGGVINLTNTDLNIGGLFSPAVGRYTNLSGVALARNVYVGGQGDGTGTAVIAGGTLVTSNLEVNAGSRFFLNQGLVQSRAATVVSAAPFVVGDGTNLAEFRLLGGTNAFTTGLRVATNSLLTGNGTVSGNVTNFGAIAPGTSAGRLDFIGSLVLSNSSDLRLEIGGYNSNQFDFARVTGNTILGGKLSVTLSNNFLTTVTNGASFTNLTSSTAIAGAFTNVPSGGLVTTVDGYARFTAVYAGATSLRLTNLVIVDTDGDGMPDWWEDLYGLNKNSAADATLDADGDGATNLDEFRAGTLPNNASSVFRVIAFQPETNNLRITWTTVAGKSYRVQTNASPANGSITNNFADFSPLISIGGVGESTTNFVHAGGFTNLPARYYRVRLGP